jgi:hypothetical protein
MFNYKNIMDNLIKISKINIEYINVYTQINNKIHDKKQTIDKNLYNNYNFKQTTHINNNNNNVKPNINNNYYLEYIKIYKQNTNYKN